MVEIRKSHELASLFAFPVVSTLAFGYTYYGVNHPILPFVFLWITLLFTVVFTTMTSFIREAEKKTLLGLKTLPCSPLAQFISKLLYSISINTFVGLTIIILIQVFIGLQQIVPGFYLLFLLELTCLSTVSSLASALTMYSEGKTLILPFILFFFSLPSITTTIIASENMVLGFSYTRELGLIAIYTIIIFVSSIVLIDYLLED